MSDVGVAFPWVNDPANGILTRWSLNLLGANPQYSNGNTHLGAVALETIINRNGYSGTLEEFARQYLFDELNITLVNWPHETNDNVNGLNEGTDPIIGWGEVVLRPRDMARLGQLMLDGGCDTIGNGPQGSCSSGTQIVDQAWARQSISPVKSQGPGGSCASFSYGALWWVDWNNLSGFGTRVSAF